MEFRDPLGAHGDAGIPVVGQTYADMEVGADDLAGLIFQNCVFERVRLAGTALMQTTFVSSRFEDCVIDDCHVVQTRWIECEGSGLRIVRGELDLASFSASKLAEVRIEQAGSGLVLSESAFERLAFDGPGCNQHMMTASGCSFGSLAAQNAVWRDCSIVELDFGACELAGADFERCCFIRATGNGYDFSDIRFKSCNLYQGEYREARFRNAEGSIFAECDLAGADFAEANLAGALFSKSTAGEASFERAVLDGAMFPQAVLTGARFAGASAVQSAWMKADLTGADFRNVNAFRSSFRNAVFEEAEVDRARLVEADLHGVEQALTAADTRGARGTLDWRAEREAEAEAGWAGEAE